jgi:putative tricarboxylic transport membrane protein
MPDRARASVAGLASLILVAGWAAPAMAWEPSKPVEFIVPAGTGGGADQMARLIAPLVDKYKLSPRPLVVVNKAGGAGAEGFTYVKAKSGDAHTIIITLSNLFTTPLHTGVPFSWRDLTPIARVALDEFILWVNAESPYTTAREYVDAVRAKPGTFKMGGTGSAQEDQIITIQLEQALGLKFIYVPFRGGGEVCANLVGKHVDSTVNNPIECAGHWKANRVRPLAVFDEKRLTAPGWGDIPTVKEALGADISYLMLRGIFGPPGMPAEAVRFYQEMLRKVYETPEFKDYLEKGALNPAWQTGPDYVRWLEGAEALHRDLMKKGGLLK